MVVGLGAVDRMKYRGRLQYIEIYAGSHALAPTVYLRSGWLHRSSKHSVRCVVNLSMIFV